MIVNILVGLFLAVIVFVVLTSLVVFKFSVLLFGLLALIIFCAVAFGGHRFVR